MRFRPWMFPAGLIALTFLVYARSLGNDFVNWDDGLLVYNNMHTFGLSWANIKWAFTHFDPELYIPLTFLSYQLDYTIAGLNPTVYHTTNLLLHVGNVLLVFWILRQLIGSRWAAFFCALTFGIHPLNTEAVAWISGRKDVLSAFFFFVSLGTYMQYRRSKVEGRRSKWYWLSVVVFLCGLLSKVSVASLPIILLLVDYVQRRPFSRRLIIEKIPYFVLAFVLGIVAIVGKAQLLSTTTPDATILMGMKATVFYVHKLILPLKLSVLYPYLEEITIFSPDFFVPALIVIATLIGVWKSHRRTRVIVFGIGFYLLMLAPTFNNFTKGGPLDVYFASDRYTYISSVGLLYLLGMAGLWIVNNRSRMKPLLFTGSIIALCLYAGRAHTRSMDWVDSESLYLANLATYPDSYIVQNNLGSIYMDRGKIEKAMPMFQRAIELNPTHFRGYANMGAALGKLGRYDEGLPYLLKAMELDPTNEGADATELLRMLQEGKMVIENGELKMENGE